MRFISSIFLSLSLLAHPALALDVKAVRIGDHSDKQRIVIELSAPSTFKAYTMENPNRLIIDMPDFKWAVGTIQKPVASLVSDIRHGAIGNHISRVVLEASAPVSIVSSFALPADKTQPNRIVIDFKGADTIAKMPVNKEARPYSASTVQNLAAKRPIPVHAKMPKAPITPTPQRIAEQAAIQTADKTFVNSYEPEMQPEPVKSRNHQKPLIIIDPGHGGQDPGARAANGAYEKSIVLAVGLELKRILEDSGQYRVQMTRDSDVFIPLKDRVKFARRNGGDLFVSLHADSMANSTVSGASVYTLSDTASDKEAEKLAERENKSDAIAGVNLSNQDNDVANILIDLASRDTMNQSRYLANTVVATMPAKGVEMLARKPHRSAGFAVLKAMDIPSILVEMGYLTNMQEANRLSTREYRIKVASGLKSSVDAYFTKVAKLNTP